MRKSFIKLALTATLGLAMALTLSCLKYIDDGNDESNDEGINEGIDCYYLEPCIEGTVKIGNQVWQKCNSNYNAPGSVCYGEDTKDEGDDHIYTCSDGSTTKVFTKLSNEKVQAFCATYGRLYDWTTAMALPDSCDYKKCASQIKAKHRGICPQGWHIPSEADWNELLSYVGYRGYYDASRLDQESIKEAGIEASSHLKATYGWTYGDRYDSNGDNTSGFSALPGSYKHRAYWGGGRYESYYNWGLEEAVFWSASEPDESDATLLDIDYTGVAISSMFKRFLVSVRCLQDSPDTPSSSSTLSCVSVPTEGKEGTAITAPTVTCNGTTVSNDLDWTGAPTWANPAAGTYSGISVSVRSGDCRGKTASCSGTLTVTAPGRGNDIANYKTVQIGTQVWMAENLNYYVDGSKCYNNNASNCATYGRLYDWVTAMALPSSCNSTYCASQVSAKHRGICPSGWHIPSDAEWKTLMDYVGGSSTAGTKLKANSDLWKTGKGTDKSDLWGKGTDNFDFAALPGGRGYSDGSFYRVGINGYWWSTSEFGTNEAWCWSMDYYTEYTYCFTNIKSDLFSVRCVQDETDEKRQERQEREEMERKEKEKREMLLNLAPCVDGTVKIGTQVWQKCNLNVDPGTGNSSCYKNDPANCERFGRLYDWATAMALPDNCNSSKCASQINAKHKGLCPSGWHIPSDADWSALISYIESEKGCTKCAGKYLKVKGWNSYDTEALDSYGFAALPGGYGYSHGSFYNVGDYGEWWSATEFSDSYAYFLNLYYGNEDVHRHFNNRSQLQSVRCVQD